MTRLEVADPTSILGEQLYRDLGELHRRLGAALDARDEVEIRRMLSGPLAISARSTLHRIEKDEQKRHLQVVP